MGARTSCSADAHLEVQHLAGRGSKLPTTHPRQNDVVELGTEAEAFGNLEAVP